MSEVFFWRPTPPALANPSDRMVTDVPRESCGDGAISSAALCRAFMRGRAAQCLLHRRARARGRHRRQLDARFPVKPWHGKRRRAPVRRRPELVVALRSRAQQRREQHVGTHRPAHCVFPVKRQWLLVEIGRGGSWGLLWEPRSRARRVVASAAASAELRTRMSRRHRFT